MVCHLLPFVKVGQIGSRCMPKNEFRHSLGTAAQNSIILHK